MQISHELQAQRATPSRLRLRFVCAATAVGLVGGLLAGATHGYSLATIFAVPSFWIILAWLCGTKARSLGEGAAAAYALLACSIASYYLFEAGRVGLPLSAESHLALPWLLAAALVAPVASGAGFFTRSDRWLGSACTALPLVVGLGDAAVQMWQRGDLDGYVASLLIVAFSIFAVTTVKCRRIDQIVASTAIGAPVYCFMIYRIVLYVTTGLFET